MGLCSGKPIEFTDNRTEYEKEFAENLFKMMQQGMAQGATPMPPEMYQAMMGAYAVPSTAYGGMNILNNLAGQGPTQFNPMSMFQPQGAPLNYDWQQREGVPPPGKYDPGEEDTRWRRNPGGGRDWFSADPFEYNPADPTMDWWNYYNSNRGNPV